MNTEDWWETLLYGMIIQARVFIDGRDASGKSEWSHYRKLFWDMSQIITVLLKIEVAPHDRLTGGGPSAFIKGPLPKCGNETVNET